MKFSCILADYMIDPVISRTSAESELLDQLREGDKQAFEKLYHQYSPGLYINVLKLVKDELIAEELIQELFTRIWHKRAELHIENNFLSYLYRIAQNLVHDFYRRLQRDKKMFEHFQQAATENYEHVEEVLHAKESEHLLKKALDQLSPQQRNVYQLCKIDGYTYKQTAEKMGISPHTVKEYLSKASQLVKSYLLSNPDGFFILFFLLLKSHPG
jgi:RNA polymerase sigma-70 factor (family 1)